MTVDDVECLDCCLRLYHFDTSNTDVPTRPFAIKDCSADNLQFLA